MRYRNDIEPVAAFWRWHHELPLFLRVWLLAPLTAVTVGVLGLTLTLPPGPLCDEGMVLFMEGGCDWGRSNEFFFAKVGLLLAANVAIVVSLSRRLAAPGGFWPHLGVLAVMAGLLRDPGGCDEYYAHPNGNLGQMIVEVIAFSVLGLAVIRVFAVRARPAQAVAVLMWNAAYVVVFYVWLLLTPHWTWLHTALIAATMAVLAVLLPLFGSRAAPGTYGDSSGRVLMKP